MNTLITDKVQNWIDNSPAPAIKGAMFDKLNPANGQLVCKTARSAVEDVNVAVESARKAQQGWATTTPVARAEIMRDIAILMSDKKDDISEVVSLETGKSKKEALGETGAAIEQGFFMAGEGRRLYGKTTTSGMVERTAMSFRTPVGTAALIIAANTPIANVAWKVFPALVCGNSAVLKPAEDTPMVAWAFAQIAKEAGLPDGVLNIIHGFGQETGAPLVEHPGIDLVSFTGCTSVGKQIAKVAGARMAKVFLELGGKNPLVVCDDADLDNACKWVLLSGFSNAGQRCASASRIIIFDSIYEKFKAKLVEETGKLTVGSADEDMLGPVINQRQLDKMLDSIIKSKEEGANALIGGKRLTGAKYDGGYFLAPTIIEGSDYESDLSQTELFGPIISLYKVKNLDEAIQLSNHSDYGLTACIHTSNVHRAMEYCHKAQAGTVNVNAGTHGSEPHFGFGGVKNSGNGLREPGTEALDVYCEWKNININTLPESA